VNAPGSVEVNDEFAKTLGMESVDKQREAIKDRLDK
jgi:FKBP-type peptidyl-prolyl cis-trans isomerase (trigger factor)